MPISIIDVAVPVGASLASAITAGYLSFLAGRSLHTHQWRLALIREQILDRRQLYARFLAEADRNLMAVIEGRKSLQNITPLLTMVAEISLVGSKDVLSSAKHVAELGINANSTESEGTGDHASAKAAFIDAARSEIEALEVGPFRRARARKGGGRG